jgi:hypothetical protein
MMNLQQLSVRQQEVARHCLAFVMNSRELDGAFTTRLGATRGEAAAVLMRWPAVDDVGDESPAHLAIHNALNEVAHFIPISVAEWTQLGTDHAEVVATLRAYAGLRSQDR